MRPIALVAFGAVSPLGVGEAAVSVGRPGELPVTRVGRDERLEAIGLARPIAARAPFETTSLDRAQGLLAAAAQALARELDRRLPGWQQRRIAIAVGTSAGGMPSLEQALAKRASSSAVERQTARSSLYDGPIVAIRPWFRGPTVQILGACASSSLAIGLGSRWLDAGHAELVIAGGYDALSDFVATGFEALGATTASGLAPFRTDRDGMALGEGAALVALVRADDAPSALGFVLGFGVTNDAVHVTAPDPEGHGLARAAMAALDDAALEPSSVGLVSAHATATLHNDRAEARAIRGALGSAAAGAVVHPFKASIGHCLGASGALETLAALSALRDGILPAALGSGPVEPELDARLLKRNASGRIEACLKLSAGFGGSNAALVVSPIRPARPGRARPERVVRVLGFGELVRESSLSAILPYGVVPEARLARLSGAGALVATAVAAALVGREPLSGATTGVVVGTSAACLEENERFDRVRRERGPKAVEPRRFSRTSPNLPAGECAIVFGFSGPAFAVGGGPAAPVEALLVGHDLVARGDADHVLVATCDEVEGVASELFGAAGLRAPPHGARVAILGCEGSGPPLDRARLSDELERDTPDDAGASLFALALARATRAE